MRSVEPKGATVVVVVVIVFVVVLAVVAVCEENGEGAGEIALFSMLRGEFEAVVSMLMSAPRFFVRDRGAQPLNYFKYFQTFVARGDSIDFELEIVELTS